MLAFQLALQGFPSPRRCMGWRMSVPTIDVASVGNMCIDIILPIKQYPIQKLEHQRLLTPARLELGGSLNALIAASRLGARTVPISYIPDENAADGLLAKHMLRHAKNEGMDTTALIPHAKGVIPTCAALIDAQGSHTFLASNEDPLPAVINEPMTEVVSQIVKEASAVIIDGYAFHSERTLVERCAGTARHLWLDPQAAGVRLRRSDALFWEILTKAEGISLTLEEAQAVTAVDGDIDEVMDTLCAICEGTVLIKDGMNGCCAEYNGERCKVKGFDIQDGYRDSVGAGDSFLGAFLAARSKGLGIRDCCLVGNAMGAATCTRNGAGVTGIGTAEEVRRYLNGAVDI